jgi:hypothetical protein
MGSLAEELKRREAAARAEAARRAVTISEPDLPRPGEPPPTASLLGRASREHHGIRAVRRLWHGGYG